MRKGGRNYPSCRPGGFQNAEKEHLNPSHHGLGFFTETTCVEQAFENLGLVLT